MKKYLFVFMAVAVVLSSCGGENLLPGDRSVRQAPITFNLTASHPDATKAVKTGWEAGDAIFVFFKNVAAPKHLKMTFDGSKWTNVEYDGTTAKPGCLGLSNGNTGTMRAVFLPFGSDATLSASGSSFVFSTTYYAYYLTATLDYTVKNDSVSGTFLMTIPEGYVQFFVEDASADDGAYTLGTDAVIPTGVASIAADGTIVETSDKTFVDDMPGYVYSKGSEKGYLFSGKLNDDYKFGGHYFAKSKADGTVRHDYLVIGNEITSHDAIKLPASSSDKWIAVGNGKTVKLTARTLPAGLGTWQTCNYGCSAPEEVGTLYSYEDAYALGVPIPTNDQFSDIRFHAYTDHVWLTVHGQPGMGIKAKTEPGILFFPAFPAPGLTTIEYGGYWTSTLSDDNYPCCFRVYPPPGQFGQQLVIISDGEFMQYRRYAVRCIQE